MRLLYQIPGWMSRTEAGRREMARRREVLQAGAAPGTEIEVWDVEGGPASIESITEEALAVPGMLTRVQEAARVGVDAVIVGCYGDPGVDAARELIDLPVVGPGAASMLVAAALGHRFAILTVLDTVVHPLRRLARDVGLDGKLAAVRAVNVPVLDLARDREGSYARMLEAARLARDVDGADTLILGCMTMAFLGEDRRLAGATGLPVVNPGQAAVKFAELQVALGLRHSRQAYPQPPKPTGVSGGTG